MSLIGDRKRGWLLLAGGGAVLAIVAVWGASAAVAAAGWWLVTPRALDRCDLMVVAGGGARERLLTAAELLEDGACGWVLVTGVEPRENLEHIRKTVDALRAGVQVQAPRETTSTLGDALVTLEVARHGGFHSILVITSPYHTRRLSWVFARVLEGTGLRFGVHPSDNFYMSYDRWWANRHGRGVVMGEYVKLWAAGALAVSIVGVASLASLQGGWV